MHKFVKVFLQACLEKCFDKFVYGAQPQRKNE